MFDAQLALDFETVSTRTETNGRTTSGITTSGITICTAADLDILFEHFLGRLIEDPLAPHEPELVILPQGSALRPWLRQKLADRLGCAASLHTPSIREYADALIRRLLGADPSGLDRKALTWRIFTVLNDLPDAGDDLAPLRTYLDRSRDEAMPLARRLAELLNSYQTYRPDLLARWANGNVGADPEGWQAQLWQECNANAADRGTLMKQLLNRLRAEDLHSKDVLGKELRWMELREQDLGGEDSVDLPRRISLFGEVQVAAMHLDLLQELSRHVELTWYVVAASESRHRHPLQEAFGEDERQAARLRHRHLHRVRTERLPEQDRAATTALAILQSEIRAGQQRDHGARIAITPDDASLHIHDCHSPIRELEVLRDQLRDAFASLEDLQPSDVLVVVPDLDRYASLVEAVFSAGDPSQRLPCVVACNPREEGRRYLTAFLSLLEALDSRLTAGSILELLSEAAIGRKAQLDAESLDVIRGWIRATQIRWGADGEHRQAFGLPDDDLHTWHYGIDRLLMGFVAGDFDDTIDGVLPYAEATLDRAPVLGRLAHWIQSLTGAARQVRQTRKAAAWRSWLEGLIRRFMSAATDDEQTAEDHLLSELREMAQYAPNTVLDFVSLRSYLSDALSRFEGRGSLLSGGITVADPERLRFVPARVIACVGLNDDAFPRASLKADFDLIGVNRKDGDPDPRRLDKQLFLDMLLVARDRLILTYNGRSQKDNSERAPSVAVDALLETCLQTFTMGEAEPSMDAKCVRDHIVVKHPLQPFSPHYFDGSDPRLFSYDRSNCISPPDELTSIAAFAPERLAEDEPEEETISLRDLISAWSNPSKHFCKRLGINLNLADLSVADIEPHYLNDLDTYRISDRILELLLDGEPEERVEELLKLEGNLPGGALGRILYRERRAALEPLRAEVDSYGERQSVEIDVEVAGRRLVGRIRYVTGAATLFFRPAAKLKPKDLVAAWINHLGLAASGLERPTRVICRDDRKAIERVHEPLPYLEPLVKGYAEIVRAPVLLFPNSSMNFATTANIRGAKRKYDDPFTRGDCLDAYVALLNRHHDPIVDRREEFERTARAFWQPINQHLSDA